MSRIFLLFLLVSFTQCSVSNRAKSTGQGDFRFAFYNVENLFDTEDDPNTPDEEFLPESKKKWTPERYQTKLEHLAKVVEGMGFPALLGLAEVENAKVLEDFVGKTSLKGHGYGFVHYESPDLRGIDVALIYKKKVFKVTASNTIRIKFPAGMIPDNPNYTTRDLLVVEGRFQGNKALKIIVAHLPSRSGGQAETAPRRIHVANQIGRKVDEILKENPKANIVVMGDMNDEPTDESMVQMQEGQPIGGSVAPFKLYNCFAGLQAAGLGSYRYQGDWNMLDQILLSSNLMKDVKGLRFDTAVVYQADWMMYNDSKYGLSPSRTYGGDRYFGGYSDHLPVYVEFK